MSKSPSFQFYPGDWMKDPALRAVSSGARGLWIDMLCLMHENIHRGYLQHGNGQPVTTEQIARMTGNLSLQEVEGWIAELENCGVFSRSASGVIYSRRMLRDERKRQACQEAGKKGGNPALLKHKDLARTLKGQDNHIPKGTSKGTSKGSANPEITPSSSSSSSTSVKESDPYGSGATAPAPKVATGKKPTQEKQARAPDPLYEHYATAYAKSYGTPYLHKEADFVQLANLRKKISGVLTLDDWSAAVAHFLASPMSEHSLADLAVRYPTFRKHALDRYNKPVESVNGNGNGETWEQEKQRRLREAQEREKHDAARRTVKW